MDESSRTVNPACVCPRRAQASKDCEKHPVEFKPYHKILLSVNLGAHCREWPAGKPNAEVQMLVEANSKPQDIVVYTEDSVTRDRSGWGFTIRQGERTVNEDSGTHSRDFQSDHGGRSSHTCNTVASLPM